jgi:restriction endonuclease S subunit
LRYDLSSQRALDNATRLQAEHDRLLAEIDALARRLDTEAPTAPGDGSAQRVA